MYISRLELVNYRNIEHQIIEPAQGVNLIYGDNAQGKTNIIESIWLFTGCRSFRSPRDCEVVSIGKPGAKMFLDYYGNNREQCIEMEISGKRAITHNGVKLKRRAEIIGQFTAVVFSPVHLSLIKGGPAERRRFIDIAIGQQRPSYSDDLIKYRRAVENRNFLMRDKVHFTKSKALFEAWEGEIARLGGRIIYNRFMYLQEFSKKAVEIYAGLSGDKERLTIKYSSQAAEARSADEARIMLVEKLEESRNADHVTGITSVGPHRDDLIVKLSGSSARAYGSQGQQRSCSLSLKLAEAEMVRLLSGEEPVILLDDVMSELDVSRQKYILNHLADRQVFITCCDTSALRHLNSGRTFEISAGAITGTDEYHCKNEG